MISVTITRDMRPFRAGEVAHLDDDVARQLVRDGDATEPRSFPAGEPIDAVFDPAVGRRYRTKG